MSIRRVSDLPSISSEIAILSDSFIEISELQSKDTYTYKSKKMNLSDFRNNMLKNISNEIKIDFSNGVQIQKNIELSGDLFINTNLSDGEYEKYSSSQLFGDYNLVSERNLTIESNSIRLKTGNAAIEMSGNSTNTVILNQQATVSRTNANDNNSVVNVKFLSEKLEELKNEIMAEVTALIGGSQTNSFLKLPLLTFVYSDHKITDDPQWAEQGTQVDLKRYSVLKQFLIQHKDGIRFGTASGKDTWFYKYDETNDTITLPYTNWFIQGTTNSSVEFLSSGIPNITGTMTQATGTGNGSGYWIANGAFQASGYGAGHNAWGVGRGPNSVNFDASRSSVVYGRSTTVQPNSTKMFIYFYIGPKNEE